jgi:hypothetical protein
VIIFGVRKFVAKENMLSDFRLSDSESEITIDHKMMERPKIGMVTEGTSSSSNMTSPPSKNAKINNTFFI